MARSENSSSFPLKRLESYRRRGSGSRLDKGPQPLAGNEIEGPYPQQRFKGKRGLSA